MKNKLLLLFMTLFVVSLNAQTIIVDFEANASGKPDTNQSAEWTGDSNAPLVTLETNPSVTGINTTANVVKFVETLNSHAGNSLQFSFNNTTDRTGFNLTANKFVKFMVYSEDQTNFDVTLHIGNGGSNHFEMTNSITTTLNTWTEVVFDFTGNSSATINTPGGWVSNVRIHFNNGTNGVGDTFYVDELSITPANYVTVADGDWGTASNWYPASAPVLAGVSENIEILHNMTYTGNLTVDNMTIKNGSRSLVVTGDFTTVNPANLWAGSSMLVSGTATGTFNYYRSLTHTAGDLNGWYLLSSPVAGEEYDDTWISTYKIASGTGSNRGIATYNNAGSTGAYWSYAEAPVASTPFAEGIGYSMKVSENKAVVFQGTIRTADVTDIALTKTGMNGYNLVGNTFAGFVDLDALLTANDSAGNDLLTSSTIWVWDSSSNSYVAKTGSFKIAPGQAFFVEATAAASTFAINTSMVSAISADTFLKSSKTEIQLNITDGDLTRYAKVSYLDNTTEGFDNGFDGKLFGGVAQPFAVYTHLLNDNNGTKYQLQGLPSNNLESMVVPVGVNAAAGKEITFSAEALNLPSGIKVFLEDRVNNTFTRLDEANSNLKITLTDALNGTGRFYLHTTSSALSVSDDALLGSVSIFKSAASTLRIAGLSQGKSNVKLYNILGKKVMETSFNTNGVQDISLPKLATGIYIVQLETETGKLNKKITLE
jgi:hypothetical protein